MTTELLQFKDKKIPNIVYLVSFWRKISIRKEVRFFLTYESQNKWLITYYSTSTKVCPSGCLVLAPDGAGVSGGAAVVVAADAV